jgi:molybdate transport system substrate-binding protein
MRVRTFLVLALLAAGPAVAGEKHTINVAAAANLKDAAAALAKAYQAEHPGVEIAVTLGASGTFFAQIQSGAPFDLFLSADREYPDQIVAGKLAPAADEHVYALGKLVVWIPPDSKLPLASRGLQVLADPAVTKVAIANPALAPYGRAAEAALKAVGVYDAVKEKLVLGTSVAQVAQFATTGAADAAFLPYSLVLGKELSTGTFIAVPEQLYPKIEQAGVVLSGAREPSLARGFLEFILGEKGRATLAKFGYGLP